MDILRLVARRVLFIVPITLGVTFAVFLLTQFSPANPAISVLGLYASKAQRQAFLHSFHLDDPLVVRYPRFLWDLLHGDMGVSVIGSRPVSQLIANALPVTLSLACYALIIAVVVGVALGTTAALRQGRLWDSVVRVLSMAWLSIPTFWFALLLIRYLAISAHWFPAGGYVSISQSPGGWFLSLTLPALALGFPIGGWLARIVRASVLEELNQDYVRTARGSGLPEHVVIGRNVLRNALVAPLTVIGLQVGYLISGALVIEVIFTLPGLGSLLQNAAQSGDIAVVQGVTLVSAVGFVLVNLVTDVLYLALNPRVRYEH